MYLLSIISFLLLGSYLTLAAMRFGIPAMVSDTYYQLQHTTGNFKKARNLGWLFSVVMLATALTILICILDTGKGIQPFAFLGCTGLAFVGCAPNYLDQDEYKVHKWGATIAAMGCIGWGVSVCWWVTLTIAVAYILYLSAVEFAKAANSIWYISKDVTFHPWYWAEVAAFVDLYLSYWTI